MKRTFDLMLLLCLVAFAVFVGHRIYNASGPTETITTTCVAKLTSEEIFVANGEVKTREMTLRTESGDEIIVSGHIALHMAANGISGQTLHNKVLITYSTTTKFYRDGSVWHKRHELNSWRPLGSTEARQ